MLTLQVKVGPKRSKEYGWALMECAFMVNHTGSSDFRQEAKLSFSHTALSIFLPFVFEVTIIFFLFICLCFIGLL